MASAKLEAELAELATLSLAQLRDRWTEITRRPLPRLSADMLRLALAWELQARIHGGLPRRTRRKLDQLRKGKSQTRDTIAGMRLVREWNGTLHVVTIEEDGVILWNGQRWPSLSKVAREITGTRWSGPAFFGLKLRKEAA